MFQISKILTKNQEVRSENLTLKKNLDEAMNKFELIFGEKIDLENFAEAMQVLIVVKLFLCLSMNIIIYFLFFLFFQGRGCSMCMCRFKFLLLFLFM